MSRGTLFILYYFYISTLFGHTLIKLVEKLISTTIKEKNQVIAKNINANKKNDAL